MTAERTTVGRLTRRAVTGIVGVAALAGTAPAHPGDERSTGLDSLHGPTVAAALFLLGVGAFAASIHLHRTGRASGRVTDAGVGLGVVCVLGSVVALWV